MTALWGWGRDAGIGSEHLGKWVGEIVDDKIPLITR